jgi:hypothetical protein
MSAIARETAGWARRCLCHAAGVAYGQENFQLAKLEPAVRAVMPIQC